MASDMFSDMLPLYYRRLFPYELFYKWLSYGNKDPNYFQFREMSFTLKDDVYIRYLSFTSEQDMETEIKKKNPEKIDIGAVYNFRPKDSRLVSVFLPMQKELVLDIDMTDYDEVRTCCTGADVCTKCWRLMNVACKVLDTALREDFGFELLLWVFSGRRGIHCWVCDEAARKLDQSGRSAVAEYLHLVVGGDMKSKKLSLHGEKIPFSIKRAINIVGQQFVKMCVEEQDILGSPQNIAKFLAILDDNMKTEMENEFQKYSTSVERWEAFMKYCTKLQEQGLLKKRRHIIEEIMLQYTYPRLDINVSRGLNHLLKAPFCIHPKTGKLCIPFNPKSVDKFNPMTVPTLDRLIDEIVKYDAKTKEFITQGDTSCKVKDYKKTSMYKGILIFEEFLRNLEKSYDTGNDLKMEC